MTRLLRRATLDDLDAIMQIENATFGSDAWPTEAMRSELGAPHTYYLVAVGDGIEGYLGLAAPHGGEQADIQTIAVVPQSRRTGLGKALMNAALVEARARGAHEVFLEVRADNPGARAMYAALGFEQIAVRQRYYQPDGVDAQIMRLQLGAPTVVTA